MLWLCLGLQSRNAVVLQTYPTLCETTKSLLGFMLSLTVTVTEAVVLRPLLEDRGRITESSWCLYTE